MKTARILLVILIACSLSGCRRGNLVDEKPPVTTKVPLAIVIEKEIKGKFGGLYLNDPFGLTSDFQGNIYLTDSGNDRLLKFDSSFNYLSSFGGFSSDYGRFNHPTFITFDNGLNLMVSDEKNRQVVRYNRQLSFIDAIEIYDYEEPLRFGYPAGIGLTEYGETWVADNEKNQIIIYDNVGRFDRVIGDYGSDGDELNAPEKIVSTFDKNFIVCDAGNKRLVIYDQFGNFINEIELKNSYYPMALAIEKDRYWIVDGAANEIICTDLRGTVLFRTPPVIAGTTVPLRAPSDILLLESGRLVISDSKNNRLLILKIIYEN